MITNDIDTADNHLTITESGKPTIYVPQWFEDFKTWSNIVLEKIERGELEDIEVFKTNNQ